MLTQTTIERLREEARMRNQAAAQARRMIERGYHEPHQWEDVQATPGAIAMAIEGMDTDTLAAFIHKLLFTRHDFSDNFDNRDYDDGYEEGYEDGLAQGKEAAQAKQEEADSPTARMLRKRYGTTTPKSVRDFFVGGA